jgi:hypothetical protein
MIDFIYVSSERWTTAQEKQHLPWRFLDQPRVLFIEEPLSAPNQAQSELVISAGFHMDKTSIRIIRLLQPAPLGQPIHHGDVFVQPIYNKLLSQYIEGQGVTSPILWLCNLQGIGFTEILEPRFMVVDTSNEHEMTENLIVQPVDNRTAFIKAVAHAG